MKVYPRRQFLFNATVEREIDGQLQDVDVVIAASVHWSPSAGLFGSGYVVEDLRVKSCAHPTGELSSYEVEVFTQKAIDLYMAAE